MDKSTVYSILKTSFREAAWAPMAVFVFYVAAAKIFNAYILFPNLDIATHFAGGLAITYFSLVCLFHLQPITGNIPRVVQIISAVGFTAITAIVWEFLEYFSDYLLHTEMNLGTADTLSDLFFGLLGAFVIALSSLITHGSLKHSE